MSGLLLSTSYKSGQLTTSGCIDVWIALVTIHSILLILTWASLGKNRHVKREDHWIAFSDSCSWVRYTLRNQICMSLLAESSSIHHKALPLKWNRCIAKRISATRRNPSVDCSWFWNDSNGVRLDSRTRYFPASIRERPSLKEIRWDDRASSPKTFSKISPNLFWKCVDGMGCDMKFKLR